MPQRITAGCGAAIATCVATIATTLRFLFAAPFAIVVSKLVEMRSGRVTAVMGRDATLKPEGYNLLKTVLIYRLSLMM